MVAVSAMTLREYRSQLPKSHAQHELGANVATQPISANTACTCSHRTSHVQNDWLLSQRPAEGAQHQLGANGAAGGSEAKCGIQKHYGAQQSLSCLMHPQVGVNSEIGPLFAMATGSATASHSPAATAGTTGL